MHYVVYCIILVLSLVLMPLLYPFKFMKFIYIPVQYYIIYSIVAMHAHLTYLPSSVTTISGNLVQYFLSYIILVIHDIEAHKMLHHTTYMCKYVLIRYVHNNNCEKSEPPTRTNGARCLYA